MNKDECVRMKLLSLFNILNIYAGMNRTTSVEKLDVLVGALLCNIVSEVAVRDKENVLIVKIVYDFNSRRACYSYIANCFEFCRSIDICNNCVIGIHFLNLRNKLFVHLVCHTAAGNRLCKVNSFFR